MLGWIATVLVGPAQAELQCGQAIAADHSSFVASVACASPARPDAAGAPAVATPYRTYQFKPLCSFDPGPPPLVDIACSVSTGCPQIQMPGYLYGNTGDGRWVRLQFQCRPLSRPPAITPESVASAFARIRLPRPRSHAQPTGKTLVNFDTIFFAEVRPLRRSVTLLGQQVELSIRPTLFTWEFGDGHRSTTRTAGARYPSKEIVHRYEHGREYRHHVTTTWAARWRFPGGIWRPVTEVVETSGPSTTLQVVEAVPNLAGSG